MIRAVEIVAKIGDSIIEIARVEAGTTYSCALVPFPLVCGDANGFVVHRPVGVRAWNRGALIDETKVRIHEGDSLVLELARVTLYVLPIATADVAVPKKRIEVRPYIYGAAVLVAHLFVWGLAEARFAPPLEKLSAPLPQRRVHVAHVEETPPPAEKPAMTIDATPSTAKAKGSRTKGRRGATSGEQATLGAFGDVSMLVPSVDVVKLVNESVAYDEQAAEDAKWGGSSGHFDPFRECKVNCGTIASGPYETLSFQNRPRPTPRIAVASDDAGVKAAITAARGSLAACYVDRALDGDIGSVQVELSSKTDGKLALLYSRGLDTVGPCVGSVIDALHLKGPSNSQVSITIAFTFQ